MSGHLMKTLIEVGPDYRREKFIGGSDIGGILGVSPWATPISIWQRKTGNDNEESKPAKRKLYARGKAWEGVVCEMLVAKLEDQGHKVEILSTNHRYVDQDVPYFACEVDIEMRLDGDPNIVNGELKTVHPNAAREWDDDEESDQFPTQYAAQCQWGLGITGRNCCILAPLFGADLIRAYVITRDDEIIAGMRQQADLFWNLHVLTGTPPAPTNLADVNRLFKQDAETIVTAEPWVVEKLLRYRATDAEISAREAERDVLEFEIKNFMRDATILQVAGQEKPAATWKSRANAHLDQASFKADYPKLHAQYMRKGSARVFDVKALSIKDAAFLPYLQRLTQGEHNE